MTQSPSAEPTKWDHRLAKIAIGCAIYNLLAFLIILIGLGRVPVVFITPSIGIVALLGIILGLYSTGKKLYRPWLGIALFVNINFAILIACAIFGPALIPPSNRANE